MPTLKKALEGGKRRAPEPQSIEQQAAIIRELHAKLGGTLTHG